MTTEMQLVRGQTAGLAPRSMAEAVTLAEYAAKSGLCAVREPAQALVVLMTGMELGLSPMQSFRGIHVVNGKPVLSADLLVAIVRASGVCKTWLTLESSIDRCTIETHREGDAAPVRKTWTMEDARRAKLDTPVWRSYPAQMLRHRCAADLAREVYSDIALGCYTPDEVSDGRVSDADVGTVTVVGRASPPALNVYIADLADVTTLRALRACWETHATALHAAGDADTARIDAAKRMAAIGYALSADEVGATLRGVMHSALTDLHDALSEVMGSADNGDDVIADIVRALRKMPSLPEGTKDAALGAAKKAALVAAVRRAAALGVTTTKEALTALLRPTPPDGGPSGTRTPAAPSSADATAAPLPSTAANDAPQASAGPRVVLDADETEARYLRDDAIGAEAWAAHLTACAAIFAMAGSHTKRVDAFRAAGVLATRRAQTLDAIEAREGRGPEAAMQALDGYRTRRVVPIGQSVRARTAAEIRAAQRTGTDG